LTFSHFTENKNVNHFTPYLTRKKRALKKYFFPARHLKNAINVHFFKEQKKK
jgi:hypothetical protein